MYRVICDECNKKPAARKVVTFNSDKKKVQYLCEDCYYLRQKNATISIMNSIAGKISGANAVNSPVSKYKSMCSKCQTTETEFLNTGLLGCENCYNDLTPAILSMIKSSQGKLAHMGKTPIKQKDINEAEKKNTDSSLSEDNIEEKQDSEILILKKQLEDSIMDENFELASELRDKIKSLEKEDESNA